MSCCRTIGSPHVESFISILPVVERRLLYSLAFLIHRCICRSLTIYRRSGVPNGSGTAKAIDYALKRWQAIENYLNDGRYPIDNNPVENAIRPIALGRKNWLFMGTEQAGRRAANIMSLIASARLNDLNPWLYLKDVLTRLPTHPHSRLNELLPYYWKPAC